MQIQLKTKTSDGITEKSTSWTNKETCQRRRLQTERVTDVWVVTASDTSALRWYESSDAFHGSNPSQIMFKYVQPSQ